MEGSSLLNPNLFPSPLKLGYMSPLESFALNQQLQSGSPGTTPAGTRPTEPGHVQGKFYIVDTTLSDVAVKLLRENQVPPAGKNNKYSQAQINAVVGLLAEKNKITDATKVSRITRDSYNAASADIKAQEFTKGSQYYASMGDAYVNKEKQTVDRTVGGKVLYTYTLGNDTEQAKADAIVADAVKQRIQTIPNTPEKVVKENVPEQKIGPEQPRPIVADAFEAKAASLKKMDEEQGRTRTLQNKQPGISEETKIVNNPEKKSPDVPSDATSVIVNTKELYDLDIAAYLNSKPQLKEEYLKMAQREFDYYKTEDKSFVRQNAWNNSVSLKLWAMICKDKYGASSDNLPTSMKCDNFVHAQWSELGYENPTA